jgi:Cu(I)/Ag(I) efflux system membrane fusion protein
MMSTRRQVAISILVVAAATGGVLAYETLSDGKDGVVESGGHADHSTGLQTGQARPIILNSEQAGRIGVTFATAERRSFVRAVRAVGNVSQDETRLAKVSPKIEGWVERLHVDFTGASVREGDPLLEVYSPMLVVAQEELILARRLLAEAEASGSERSLTRASELVESARRRLRYWDVPEEEIARIESTGFPQKTVTLRAPAGGAVIEKNVVVGSRIMPGMDLYTIADLSRVWLEVEVFEKDLSLVRLGQHAVVLFDAYPGEEFDGLVAYVYPTVSIEARTGRVRLELANPGLRLRPGMYASVELHLAGPQEALLVPRGAVLQTGERSVVFTRGAGGALVPRDVVVGLLAGNDIEILSGLAAGDIVVSSANFLIDAESNLAASIGARPSWSGETESAAPAEVPVQSGSHIH